MDVGRDEVVVEVDMTGLTPEDAVGPGRVPSKARGGTRREHQLWEGRRRQGGEKVETHCSGTEASHNPS